LVSIKVKEGESGERALRRFKKKWEKAGILREFKSRAYYLKPSEKKKIERQKRGKRPQTRRY
jgi:small subunit ribosomal protein S21|tara:strand:- start:2393 stop:2578 length:186 start_codon:yes stop_codon:yes gene_type:complete